MPPIDITTTGSATIARPAERAILTITIKDNGPDATTVTNNVVTRTNQIKQILEPLNAKTESGSLAPHAAITHFSMGSLSKFTYNTYNNNSEITGKEQHVSITFEVKFQDFNVLSSVATELSGMQFVEIRGIDWKLTDATRDSLQTQVREMAGKDAFSRALDYARTFGKRAIDAVEISEGEGGHPGFGVQRRFMMARQSSEEPPQLEFQPEDVEMRAQVTVKFITN
ncbi:hypothetical protein BDW59DRAFT_153513 [Aspergillus cavernicola]|uniref:DUF541 domain-containing protein n=1 Tax=Aspergillus cavernicola TaxID=176166 RepID=A0ABR4HKZ1_9EURO